MELYTGKEIELSRSVFFVKPESLFLIVYWYQIQKLFNHVFISPLGFSGNNGGNYQWFSYCSFTLQMQCAFLKKELNFLWMPEFKHAAGLSIWNAKLTLRWCACDRIEEDIFWCFILFFFAWVLSVPSGSLICLCVIFINVFDDHPTYENFILF